MYERRLYCMAKNKTNVMLTVKSCKEFRKILIDLDWTVVDVAKHLDVSRQYLDNFLNRLKPISREWIRKLCDAVQTDSWLHQDE